MSKEIQAIKQLHHDLSDPDGLIARRTSLASRIGLEGKKYKFGESVERDVRIARFRQKFITSTINRTERLQSALEMETERMEQNLTTLAGLAETDLILREVYENDRNEYEEFLHPLSQPAETITQSPEEPVMAPTGKLDLKAPRSREYVDFGFPGVGTIQFKKGGLELIMLNELKNGRKTKDELAKIMYPDRYIISPNGARSSVSAWNSMLTKKLENYGATINVVTEDRTSYLELALLQTREAKEAAQPASKDLPHPEVEVGPNMLALKEGVRLAAFIHANYDILSQLDQFEMMSIEDYDNLIFSLHIDEQVLTGNKDEDDKFTLKIVRKIKGIIAENSFDDCCELSEIQLPELREVFAYVLFMHHANKEFFPTLEKIITDGVDSITIEDRSKDGSKNRYVKTHRREPNFTIEGAAETKQEALLEVGSQPAVEPLATTAQENEESAAPLPEITTLFEKPIIKPGTAARIKKHGQEERFPNANQIIGEAIKTLLNHGIRFEDEIPAAQVTNIFGIRRTDQEKLEGKGLVELTVKRHSSVVSLTFENAIRLAVFKKLKGETLNTTATKMLENLIIEALDKARKNRS